MNFEARVNLPLTWASSCYSSDDKESIFVGLKGEFRRSTMGRLFFSYFRFRALKWSNWSKTSKEVDQNNPCSTYIIFFWSIVKDQNNPC